MELVKIQQHSESLPTLPEPYSRDQRKTDGIFYTPEFLAQYLSKKVIQYFDKVSGALSVLDPACGDSILLRNFSQEWIGRDESRGSLKVVGIDKDFNAVVNSKSKFAAGNFFGVETSFFQTDGLFPLGKSSSSESWINFRRKTNRSGGFDIALSNPPWGAQLSSYNGQVLIDNFSLAKGQFDIYDLFVEIIIDNLSKDGVYGLILPDSIFGQEHTHLRYLLARNTTIHLIARLGEKIFSDINRACVVIVGKKARADENHTIDCFRLSSAIKKGVLNRKISLEQAEAAQTHKVPQNRFLTNESCIFDIDLKTAEQKITKKIKLSKTVFRDFIDSTRGVEISKKGIVYQCLNCKLWIPAPTTNESQCRHCKVGINKKCLPTDKIVLNHNGHGNLKLKVGEDLFRFTSVSKSWIDTTKNGINYKDLKIYRGEKILVRKTGVGITASLDYEDSVSNQVVYLVKLKPLFQDKLTLEFVLGVLNSRAMTYYLIKKYGENEWKSHPYLTQSMLADLPFPAIDLASAEHLTLISKVTEILRKEIRFSDKPNISKTSDLLIERVVAHFFNLTKTDYRLIFNTLASSQQLIPIKRLLNCDYNEIFNVSYI